MPFYPHQGSKSENFKKMEKTPGDLIILHRCTKNFDYMVYCSRDIARDGCNCYFSLWAIFCPFTPMTSPKKEQIIENEKIYIYISLFYTFVLEIMLICYTVPQILCVTDVIVVFHFGLFLALLPPQQPKKLKFQKNEKNSWKCHHFIHVCQNL